MLGHALQWLGIRTASAGYGVAQRIERLEAAIAYRQLLLEEVVHRTKNTLQLAASQVNKSVSQFLLDAAMTAAAKTLEDRRSFVLDKRRWDAFVKILDRPPRIKRRLARLLAERSVLE